MNETASKIAHVLLREGAFNRSDPEHKDLYAQLVGDSALYDEVSRRLAQVGYELVQSMGHAGIRVSRERAAAIARRNNMGLHAGHVRLLVYLWTHLVYRERLDLRRDLKETQPGTGQMLMVATDEPPGISYKQVFADFAESTRKTHFTQYLKKLRRWRFVRYDEKRDRIWADAMLYTLIDPNEMESFVIDLARRLGTDTEEDAVLAVATGTPIPANEGDTT
jgi:hypothetical protein